MIVKVSAIELDTSIQCRATIDTGVVNDYSERMLAGDDFPPVELFGTKEKSWIGDGWHRTLAARSIERETIAANLHPGGRADALKHALGANVIHGHRRSNADKRRCVEIALREFPKLSSRALATMCGVSNMLVDSARPEALKDSSNAPSTRTTSDGRQYPARRTVPEPQEPDSDEPVIERTPASDTAFIGVVSKVSFGKPVLGPPRDGMGFARLAIMDLEQIRPDDAERDAAFESVLAWISEHWKRS